MKKGWEIKKLGEIAEYFNGLTYSPKEVTEKGTIVLRSSNILNDELDFSNLVRVNANVKEKLFVKEGDILMCSRNGSKRLVGKSAPIKNLNEPMTFGTFMMIIRSQFTPFLLYFFKTDEFKKQISGGENTMINQVTRYMLDEIRIPFPSPHEQQCIVSILDKAFAAIEKAKAKAEQNLRNAKELFNGVLDEILHDKKWNIKRLGEVCEKVEYGTSSKAHTQGKLPVLRMGNIQNGRFIWNNLVYSDNEEDNDRYRLKYNDVLFNRTNSPELVGKTAIYKGERPAIFAGYLIRIHRKEDLLDADYLNYYLNSSMANEHGKTVVISSVNQANINGTKLKDYPVPIPTLQEQKTIVRKLDSLRTETHKLEIIYQKKITELEDLKKSILKKAFVGELRNEQAEQVEKAVAM